MLKYLFISAGSDDCRDFVPSTLYVLMIYVALKIANSVGR